MTTPKAVSALSALAQDTRLAIFRALVQRGPEGMSAGSIGEEVTMIPSSLSFHLALLAKAGLVSQRRQSRSLIYTANFDAINDLVSYLTENCCGGSSCGPICLPADQACVPAPVPEEPHHETPARPRRRQRSR